MLFGTQLKTILSKFVIFLFFVILGSKSGDLFCLAALNITEERQCPRLTELRELKQDTTLRNQNSIYILVLFFMCNGKK